MKSVPENELFSAYLDGELTPDEQARIEDLIDANAEAAALVRSLRAVSESIQALPQASMPKELTATILANIPLRMREAGRSPYGTDGTCDTDAVDEETGEEIGEKDESTCEEDEHLLVCCSIDSDQTPPDSNVTMEESVPQKSHWFQRFRPWTKRSRIFSIRLTSALLLACMTLGGLSWMIHLYDNGSRPAKMIAQSDTMEDKTLATASVQSVERENAAAEVAQEESYEALSDESGNVLEDSVSQESSAEQKSTDEQKIVPYHENETEHATRADGSHFAIHAQSVMPTPEMAALAMSAPTMPTSPPVPPASPRMSSTPPEEESVAEDSPMDFDHPQMISNGSMYSIRNSIPALKSSATDRDESVSEATTQEAAKLEAIPSVETASVPRGRAEKSVESMVASGSPNVQTMKNIRTDTEIKANGDKMNRPHQEFSRGGPGGRSLSGMGMSGGTSGTTNSMSSDDKFSGNVGMSRSGMGMSGGMSSDGMSGGGLMGMSGSGGNISSDNTFRGEMNTGRGRMSLAPEKSWSEQDIHDTESVNEILQSDSMGNDMENIRDISSDSSDRDSMSTDKSEVIDETLRATRSPSSAFYREQGHDRSHIAASQATRTHKSDHPWVKNLAERFTMVFKSQNSIHAGNPSTTENTTTRKSKVAATVVKAVTTSTLVAICPKTPSFCLGVADIMYTSIRYNWIPFTDDLPAEK